jgi:arginase family enzyme
MLNHSLRILNFDDSIIKQQRLISLYASEIIDLKDIGPRARLWLDKKTKLIIEKRIQDSAKNSITFLGSGDFHHISNILISQFNEPISVIDFDFHPDWDILPPRLGCGSWVNETLKNKNILKFTLFGVSSSDISTFSIQTGNLRSLKNDRLEIYPYAHAPSLVFFRSVPHNVSIRKAEKLFFSKKIYWNELQSKNLVEYFMDIIKHLPSKKVYLSIDKDCLKNEFALTNWEEGKLSLEELLLVLKLIKDSLEIVGLDITGDYSKVSIEGRVKKIISQLDHPKDIKASHLPESAITAANEETNLKILKAIL